MAKTLSFIQASQLNPSHFTLNQETKKIDINAALLAGTPADQTAGATNFRIEENKLKFDEAGVPKELDLSAFLTDIHVTGQSLEGGVLKLTQAGKDETIDIDLNALQETVTTNGANITFTGKGTTAEPLTAVITGVVTGATERGGLAVTGTELGLDLDYFTDITDAFGEVIGKVYTGAPVL